MLTRREKQILQLLARDHTSKELATLLYISTETVRSHRKSLIRKLGVKTTGGLVYRGFELGLLRISA